MKALPFRKRVAEVVIVRRPGGSSGVRIKAGFPGHRKPGKYGLAPRHLIEEILDCYAPFTILPMTYLCNVSSY